MFGRRLPQVTPQWMIVGLGNPGGEYRGTRHNVGFDVVDRLAERNRIKLDRGKHQARIGIGLIENIPVVLVKPTTYMNLSGRAVAPLAREYNLKPERILVIADDLDLPVGKTRLRAGGSAGGHNGHKSLIQQLGTTDYPRLKIGIGSVDRSQTLDHVLSPFDRDEIVAIKEAIDRSAEGIEQVVASGLEAAMSDLNRK